MSQNDNFIFRSTIEAASDDAIMNIWPLVAERVQRIMKAQKGLLHSAETTIAVRNHEIAKLIGESRPKIEALG